MPPPKRPFTTSSLTSSLKSTFASQPLLSNLTNLDKLTEHASNLAHKAPFFDALNEQFQQARAQDQQNVARPQQSSTATGDAASKPMSSGTSSGLLSGNQQQQQQQQQHEASKPNVDMSHLTEQERLMIQSVMAKAEMSDIGNQSSASMQQPTQNIHSNSQMAQMNRQQQQQQPAMMSQPFQQQQPQQQMQMQMQLQQAPMQNPNQLNQTSNMQQMGQMGGMQPLQNYQPNVRMNQPMVGGQQMNQNANQAFKQAQPPLSLNQQSQMNATSFDSLGANRNSMNFTQPTLANNQPQQNFNPINFQNSPRSALTQQTQQLVNQIDNQFNLNSQNLSGAPPSNQINLNNAQMNPQQSSIQQNPLMATGNQSLAGPRSPMLAYGAGQQNTSQQNSMFNQTQPLGPFGGSLGQRDAPSFNNQQQLLNAIQPQSGSLQMQQQQQQQLPQVGQPIMPSNQMLANNQMQQNPPLMQAQNVIGQQTQPTMNPYESLFQQQQQQQQQLQARGGANFPYGDPATVSQNANLYTQQAGFMANNQPMGPQQQQQPFFVQPAAATAANFQPESILRNRDAREGIRFKPDTFRDEHYAISDQETYGDEHRLGNRRNLRRRDERSLRRYDSLDANARPRRERPRESRPLIVDRSTTPPLLPGGLGRQRQLPKLGQLARQTAQSSSQSTTSGPTQQMRATPPMKRSLRLRRDQEASYSISSDSDEFDEVSVSLSEISSDRTRRAAGGERRAAQRVLLGAKSVDLEAADERSLNRLNELKLTEQAGQVMEQQQQLIQQSQELIKLQQAQLEQQTRNKDQQAVVQVPCAQTCQAAAATTNQTSGEVQQKAPTLSRQASLNVDGSAQQPQLQQQSQQQQRQPIEVVEVVRSGAAQRAQDQGRSTPKTISKATSIDSIDLVNIGESEPVDYAGSRAGRIGGGEQRVKRARQPYRTGAGSVERTPLSRYEPNHALLSPAESTDSDSEFVARHRDGSSRSRRATTHRSQRGAQQQARNRLSAHKREPLGLPPSPLPVNAAIQLHQLQQKLSRDEQLEQTRASRRAAYLRSRSVCNSPDRSHNPFSHRSIDLNMQQLNSPCDTLSELGGRRKRLPEPPTNSVALTPAMVRKMISAQRAAASSSSKLLTSVNAQSTLLTNMHSHRSPCLDRAPSENLRLAVDVTARDQPRYSPMSSFNGRSIGAQGGAPPGQVSFADRRANQFRATSSDRYDRSLTLQNNIDLARFRNEPTNFTQSSILKPTARPPFQIDGPSSRPSSDMDRMLRDIDASYDCASSRQFTSNYQSRYDTANRLQQRPGLAGQLLGTNQAGSSLASGSYLPRPANHPIGYLSGASNFRRNSDGASGQLGNMTRPSHYSNRQVCFDQSNTSTSSSDRHQSYRPHSTQQRVTTQPMMSPMRAYSSLRYNNRHNEPPSATGSEAIAGESRHLARWPGSYLDSVEPRLARHLGVSLEGGESAGLDRLAPVSAGLGRYAGYQSDRYLDISDRESRRLVSDRYFDRPETGRAFASRYGPSLRDMDFADRMSRFRNNPYRSLNLDT